MKHLSQENKDRLMSFSKEELIESIENLEEYRKLYDLATGNAFRAIDDGLITKELFENIFECLPDTEQTVKEALTAHISYIKSKRIFPTLKGQIKAKFKYEFNTMKQIFHIGSWPGYQTYLAEEFAFLWAIWGAYNFAEQFKMNEEEIAKLDKQKEGNL